MGCRLRLRVTKSSHTQKQLKEMVGRDLEQYRVARRIAETMDEKHRCWRLKYADEIQFHLDAVPSIPENPEQRRLIQESIVRAGAPLALAAEIANHTGAITDNRLWNYSLIHGAWRLSNSEGFALWFQSRIKLAAALLENRALQAKAAKVDDLPVYRWKSPLQICVQLLKRHRDIMFLKDPDGKPASIIITTLAARAYQGETDIAQALDTILSNMGKLVNPTTPRVPNPVNPAEDFADRWTDPQKASLNLEAKFWKWLRQAQIDFAAVENERKPELIVEAVRNKFGTELNAKDLSSKLGLGGGGGLLKAAATPSGLSFPDKPIIPQKPAGFA